MYEGSNEEKHNKLSFLTHRYEMLSMDENENIQSMFERL